MMMKAKKRIGRSKKTNVVPAIGTLTRMTDKTGLSQDTWVVFKNGSNRKPMLFSERFTRDDVRGAYSKINGTTKEATRSRRLKNY